MVSGGFFAFAAIKYGLNRVRSELINLPGNELNLGAWFNGVLGVLVPVEFLVMLVWWSVQSFGFAEAWWNPFSTFSLGTCLLQWGLGVILLVSMNRWMSRRVFGLDGVVEIEGGAP